MRAAGAVRKETKRSASSLGSVASKSATEGAYMTSSSHSASIALRGPSLDFFLGLSSVASRVVNLAGWVTLMCRMRVHECRVVMERARDREHTCT